MFVDCLIEKRRKNGSAGSLFGENTLDRGFSRIIAGLGLGRFDARENSQLI